MATTLTQAGADARHFLTQFRSLTKFAESIADGSELEGKIEGLKSEETKARAALDSAQTDLTKKQDEVRAAGEELKIAKANIATAFSENQAKMNTAVSEHGTTIKGLQDQIKSLRAQLTEDQVQATASIAAERASWDKELKALRAEKAKIETAIAELKKQFA